MIKHRHPEVEDEEYAIAKFDTVQPKKKRIHSDKRDKKKRKMTESALYAVIANHLIVQLSKPPRNKDQKAFIKGSWSDSENDAEDKTSDETCLMAQSSNEIITSELPQTGAFAYTRKVIPKEVVYWLPESIGSGYQQKDRKPRQNDKTEHGMEKTVQNQGQSPKMPKSESILKNQQSNRSRN
ncbi:hypothetical protein Tco_1194104 [Tanacetum coccineum]